MTPAERLGALGRALDLGQDVLPADLVDRARAVQDRAGERLLLSAEHTVAAFAGATGSGKSSLLNALTGEDLAQVDVLRPTTAEALAVVHGRGDAGPLLDWLGVRRRHVLPGDGLVLLDLPDHDSVEVAHRLEAERLVARVDLMVWVVDPQKYADAALHDRYLRPLAGHRDVLLVVLNQVDRLSPEDRAACHRDLQRLLVEDGLGGVRLLDVSARTGEGLDALRGALDDAARRREAATARVMADTAAVATEVLEWCGTAAGPTDAVRTELVDALSVAAGVPTVVDAVRRAWRVRARRATGWPPTRWLARVRPDPLRRLHLGDPGADPEVVRTSLPAPGAAERARAATAVRTYADTAAEGAPTAWVLAARDAATRGDLAGELDTAVGSAPVLAPRRPLWWTVVGVLQWVGVTALVAGLLWLGVLFGLDALLVPVPEPPRWGTVPWPTVLVVGGLLVGLVLTVLSRLLAAVGARRRARRATVLLREAVADVAEAHVVAPVEEVLARLEECRAAAELAAGAVRRRGRGRPAGRRAT